MIVFPNPLADRETYIDQLKLTESQYLAIQENSPESRIFLYKQDNEAMLCKLDLSGLSHYIRVLSGNTRANQLLNDLIKEVGNNPDQWLPLFFERSNA